MRFIFAASITLVREPLMRQLFSLRQYQLEIYLGDNYISIRLRKCGYITRTHGENDRESVTTVIKKQTFNLQH
jgi:hypothetical protein